MTRNTYMYTVNMFSTTHLCPATTAIITISKASIHVYDVALVQVVALTAM